MEISINRRPALILIIGLILSGLAAAPPRQDMTPEGSPTTDPAAEDTLPIAPPAWVSPTPDETGAIVVIVQPGESLWIIAARAGLTLADLLALNGLTEQSVINPGDRIIIGQAAPEVATPEEAAPATPLPPPTLRPTEARPEAAVCLSAFDDVNRNGIHDAGEPLRAGVAFTIYNTQAVVANYITDGRQEPKCLGGLWPGEYRITRSVAPGEILTTEGDWHLNLSGGSDLYQAFGSFIGATQTAVPAAPGGQETLAQTPASPLPSPSASQPLPPSAENLLDPRLFGVIALFLGGLLLLGAVLILLIKQPRNRPDNGPSQDGGGERRFHNIDDLE